MQRTRNRCGVDCLLLGGHAGDNRARVTSYACVSKIFMATDVEKVQTDKLSAFVLTKSQRDVYVKFTP